MKKLVSSALLLSFVLFCFAGSGRNTDDSATTTQPGTQPNQTIQLLTSPELIEMANLWATEFTKAHPAVSVAVAEANEATPLPDGSLLVSDLLRPGQTAWNMVLAHGITVPIVNTENPLLKDVSKRGAVRSDLVAVLTANGNNTAPCFILENNRLISSVADFTGLSEAELTGEKIASPAALLAAVQHNKQAVGFCRLADLVQPGSTAFPARIAILPFDKNRNGMLESFENIYDTPQHFVRGAWLGKYPRELCGTIWISAVRKPSSQAVIDFVTWLNNEGQTNLGDAGYFALSGREKESNLASFAPPVQPTEPEPGNPIWGWTLALVLGAIVVAGLVIRAKRRSAGAIHSEDIAMSPALSENSITAPAGLYYDKTHTWAFMEKDGLIKIGVDDFIQHVTGPLTQLKMKTPGDTIRKGERILTLRRDGKQLEISSPVSGIIKAHNALLLSQPAQLNAAPYDLGWVYSIEPSNWYREVRFLFNAPRYREWLEDEFIRLKDFLAASANSNKLVLQDGGELADNFLAEMTPIVWEDFQVHFLDKSK